MPYLAQFVTVATIHLLAVVSPGPDFAMVTRNSLVYSRRTGMWSAVGLGLGILVHVAYCLVGIGLLLSRSPVLFAAVKYLGAAYLLWIGAQSLLARRGAAAGEAVERKPEPGRWAAIRTGFLTNVLNPKATLFFLSLFTQVIDPKTPVGIQIFYGAEMSAATALWFALVAVMFTHRAVKERLASIQHYVVKTMGVVLVGLGLMIAL